MQGMPSTPKAIRARRHFFLLSLLAALVGALPFLPGLPGEFVFDDIPNIVGNPLIQLRQLDLDALLDVALAPQISGFTRVLPTLTFALDYWRSAGLDPEVFKTTNIIIHGLTTFALAWFFRSLLSASGSPANRAHWLAPALALAWAVHPLQVSSVLYVVQRLQTMGTLFLVLALCMYLQGRNAQIEGRSGRRSLLLAVGAWLLAMGCKEDSALFPAYALALELTVLRFRAANSRLASRLRRTYLIAALLGLAAYLLLVIPHYWHWEAYATRDFSTPERLLTQARVLCMYLWQILLPLPQNMPFYYDWVQPSRSILHPWTTLPAITLLLALAAAAWRLRSRQPLFSLGVLLFFSAHAITSNVIGLELAFEHRNHFALIGAVLAVGSLLAQAAQKLRLRHAVTVGLCVALFIALGSASLLRSHSWSNNLLLAEAATYAAPHSSRAWSLLCMSHIIAGGGSVPGNPYLDEAIDACTKGSVQAPYGLGTFARLIILKSVRGDAEAKDWERLRERMRVVPMGQDNRLAVMMLTHNVRIGVPLDEHELVSTLTLLVDRVPGNPSQLATIGYFVMNDVDKPDLAIPFFVQAIRMTGPEDPFSHQLDKELRAQGRDDLADLVRQVQVPSQFDYSLPHAPAD